MHIEDQVMAKRCGYRPNKAIVSKEEMVDRIKEAVDAKTDASFVVMARTDALASEGLDAALEWAAAYVEAGVVTEVWQYQKFVEALNVPILTNITELGKTPMLSVEEPGAAGVSLVLYPLSAFRAMNAAALKVYQTIRREGTQQGVIDLMQTRSELYEFLNYHDTKKSWMNCSLPQGGEINDNGKKTRRLSRDYSRSNGDCYGG